MIHGNSIVPTRSETNARGSALLNAIIVAGIVAGVAGIIMSQTQTTDKMSRNPRIKSAMTVLETQMLSMAMQPGIYQGCSAQAQNCQLNSTAVEAFRNLSRSIVGARCGTPSGSQGNGSPSSGSSSCGVKVQAASNLACLNSTNPGYNANCAAGVFYNPATQTFCAEIFYQGNDVAMQPVCASTTVPQSVLQGDSTSCATAANLSGPFPKVIFKGYDAAGNAVCAPIPACPGVNVSSAGNYVTSIDKLNLQTQCKTLSSGSLSCPAGRVLSNLQWTNVNSNFGTISATGNCTPRQPPADIHRVQAITSITSPPITYVVAGPTTTTTVSAPTTTMAATPWNCRDGALCGGARKVIIIDEPTSGVSPSNPGSAWIQITLNVVNGNYSFKCQCNSGTLTKIGCDPDTGDAAWVCTGGSTILPNCTWSQANPAAIGGPGPWCYYSTAFGANGGWGCRTTPAGPPTSTYPCP